MSASRIARQSFRHFSMTARRLAEPVGKETAAGMERGANYSMNLSKAQGIAPDGFVSGE
jgi:hypothetical protein